MKEFILLGATGSIGTQVLDIINKDKNFSLLGFSFGENLNKALEIIEKFSPKYVTAKKKEDYNLLKEKYPNITFFLGDKGLSELAKINEIKAVVINSLVGLVGLAPTVSAITSKKDVLLANKETLVCAGDLINKLVKENNTKLIPIDSEHSAILQCLKVGSKKDVKRLIITASGGSFRDKKRSELEKVTLDDALNHPNWSMGKKITIDSSTMVNKGLEVMEAHHLFHLPYSKISVVIQKESIIHSMVEFNDGGVIAHLATPDMHLPIEYAMYYPKHIKGVTPSLDFDTLGQISFQKMDFERFPMLKLAYFVGESGGILPLVYNTSNEVGVDLFIKGKINYLDIEKIISSEVDYYKDKNVFDFDIDYLIDFDKKLREKILKKWS